MLNNITLSIKVKYYIIINFIKVKINKKINLVGLVRLVGPISVVVNKRGRLIFGKNVTIVSGLMTNPLGRNLNSFIRVDDGALIEIGDNVGVSNTCLWAKKKIKIGDNVKIGADCLIFDSDMHSLNYEQRRLPFTDAMNAKSKEIIIGNDVFIGTRSIITKGVIIGDRSIIASGSVIVKDIPSDQIWGGNPAVFLKNISKDEKK